MVDDASSWQPCQYRDEEGQERQTPCFPPRGWTVEKICGGANHTVALLRRDRKLCRMSSTSITDAAMQSQVWVSGDGSLGQFGANSSGEELSSSSSVQRNSSTVFRRLHLPSEKAHDAASSSSMVRYPVDVAATWSNTFVVMRPTKPAAAPLSEDEVHRQPPHNIAIGRIGGSDDDDEIWCLGGEGDFGQLGVAQQVAEKSALRSGPHHIELPVPLRGDQGPRRSRVEVLSIAGGVRHVLVLARWSEKRSRAQTTPSAQILTGELSSSEHEEWVAGLFGWGASRQGQLAGPLDHAVFQDASPAHVGTEQGDVLRNSHKRSRAGASSGPPKVQWTPRLMFKWVIPTLNAADREPRSDFRDEPTEKSSAPRQSGPAEALISAGRDHSSVLVPAHWLPLPDGLEQPEDVPPHGDIAAGTGSWHIFGSNKVGQLDVLRKRATVVDSQDRHECVVWAGATWNSTFALLADSRDGDGVAVAGSGGSSMSSASRPELPDNLVPLALGPGLQLLASGKNDRGQLGRGHQLQHNGLERQSQSQQGCQLPSARIESSDAAVQPRSSLPSIVCGSEHVLALLPRPRPRPSTSEPDEASQQAAGPEVWGWGWNEHGNLALGSEDEHKEDVDSPKRIWPTGAVPVQSGSTVPDAKSLSDIATDVWAGCATSFLQLSVAGSDH